MYASTLAVFTAITLLAYPRLVSAADFTVELSTPPRTRVLAAPQNPWRVFKGVAEPPADWATANDVYLGANWKSQVAGFGYGAGNPATVLGDMKNSYSTVYMRQTFNVDEVIGAGRLKLQIDYDDGFVAFLDGKEIARANAPGVPGQWPPHNGLATAAHASGTREGYLPGPEIPALFVDEEDGPRLPHVLAIQGLNRTLADESFFLHATLLVEDLFSVTANDSIQLSGKAALPNIVRVTVNGAPAVFNSGTWSRAHGLQPGLNRLVVQALDGADTVLAAHTNDVLATTSSTAVGGPLTQNTTWDPAMGVVQVTRSVEVPSGVTLTIAAGTTVTFDPGSLLLARGGTINVAGTSSAPVFLLPTDGRIPWGGVAGSGAGSLVTLRFAEMAGASIRATNNVTMIVEDSILRDFSYDTDDIERYLIYGFAYCDITLKRSQYLRYYTSAFGGECVLRVEDCVFSDAEHDFIKPQETPTGSFIRRCLFQRSTVPGSDAIDTAVNAQLVVQDSIFRDIPDKAISLEGSDLTISNCLIYRAGTGIAVKDDSTAVLLHNTITESAYGIGVFLKNPGAQFATAFATNNIVWNNGTNITLRNPETGAGPSGSLTIVSSDIGGAGATSVYPGTGNVNKDPLFQDPVMGDFRLRTGSPVIGAGLGGRDMGPAFPLGPNIPDVIVDVPIRLSYTRPANDQFELQLHGNPNAAFVLEASGDLTHWTLVSNAAPNGILTFRDTIGDNQKFYRFQVRR